MATRKRNSRVLMQEHLAKIKQSASWLRSFLSLPSLFMWRDAPDAPLKSYTEHGRRPRTRAEVQSWELIENNEEALRRVICEATHMAYHATEVIKLAQARIDELNNPFRS